MTDLVLASKSAANYANSTIGPGLTLTASGGTLEIAAATTSVLGGIIAGAGTSINAGGTLSVGTQGTMHWSAGGNTSAVFADTYVMMGYAPYGGTINNGKARVGPSAVGSFTVAVQINGTPVTGMNVVTINSASTQTVTATAANVFVTGDLLAIVIGSVTSSPVGGWFDTLFTKS